MFLYYIIISVIIGFVIANISIKTQSVLALKHLTMGQPTDIAIETFGLQTVVLETSIFYTIIYSLLAIFIIWPSFIPVMVILKLVGIIGIGSFAMFSAPILILGLNRYIGKRPWLNDFAKEYKNTCVEYMKLRSLLVGSGKLSYNKMSQNLWKAVLDLNHRKHMALDRINNLQELKVDVLKILSNYSVEGEIEKKDRAEKRLKQIEEEIQKTKDFVAEVNDNMQKAETMFIDFRSNITLGISEKVVTDISELTNKVQALEYTVNKLEE